MFFNRLFFSFLAIMLAHSVFSQNSSPFTGYWYGMLEFMGSELIITLDIAADSEGNLTGMLHSPLQGANNIPITKLTTRGDSVYIEVKSMSAKIAGKLSDDGNKFDAVFTQAVFTIPMQFERTEELFSLKRPQEPKPPFDYTSEDIFFENTKAGIRLAGTITYPKGEGPFPAVVLISGSGPQDRNEEIFGHKPFLVIADYLTSRGIAVLRYDDRGVAQSKGDFAAATSFDFATDAEAAVNYLRQQPNINSNAIGIIGHSEGGMIAPIIAASDKSIAFIVLLAGPGITGEKVLLTQTEKIYRNNGYSDSDIKILLTDARKTYSILKKHSDKDKAAAEIRKYLNKRAKKAPADKHMLYGYTKQAAEIGIMALNSDWFRSFLVFEPETYLKDVDCPMLALFGEKDVQVLAIENSNAMEGILAKYNKGNFDIRVYDSKNHVFQNAKTGNMMEYALIEETMATDVLQDIVDWILQNTAEN